MVYKKRCKKETSPFLSNFCWCHCSIYDVIASLLLNKASKFRLVVSYNRISYKQYKVYLTEYLIYTFQTHSLKYVTVNAMANDTLSIDYKKRLYKKRLVQFLRPYLVTVTL